MDTTQWITPPWSPTLRDKLHNQGGKVIELPSGPGTVDGEWRLYGRSAGDDKSPIIMMLRAAISASSPRSPLPQRVGLSTIQRTRSRGDRHRSSRHLRLV